jgi:hypothetical protein
MKHTHGDVFMFIGIQKKRGHDFMNACIVKPIQMAGNGIIIEMRSLNAFAQQLRQIDTAGPFFKMNKSLPAAENIE